MLNSLLLYSFTYVFLYLISRFTVTCDNILQAPSTLLEALEIHMKSLESSKKGSSKPGAAVTSAINDLTAAAQSACNIQSVDEENFFFDSNIVCIYENL